MFYSIRHITRFRYSGPVHESVMELRMQPRSESGQTLRNFQISTSPRAQLYAYTDHFGNAVYHFNVLREHAELRIEAQSVIEVKDQEPLPPAVDTLEWQRYNSFNLTDEHYDLLEESDFAKSSPELKRFLLTHNLEAPRGDPLTALRHLNGVIYDAFEYEAGVTEVHSPIDQALDAGRGVCQDFAHIMIAIARHWGMPARYVSGYLYHRGKDKDRSAPTPPMPGWRPICRASAGSGSIRPTTSRPPSGISASRSDATMPTCRRRAAPSRAASRASSAWRFASSRHRRRCGTRNSCACRSR